MALTRVTGAFATSSPVTSSTTTAAKSTFAGKTQSGTARAAVVISISAGTQLLGNPASPLDNSQSPDFVAQWRNEYDHIIIDTPPCLSVTDAVLLSPEADRVILVARSGQTTRPALRRACDLLLQVNAKVMGIVLNALKLNSIEGYYYYGGSYSDSYYNDEVSNGKGRTSKDKVS